MIILRFLLLPFAVLYGLATRLRNLLFDLGLKPSTQFDMPCICVGNLTVGGTGKSPMIEHLIRLLSPDFQVATLSRGYGRTTKGMRVANSTDTAQTLGDEPFQFYRKFNSNIVVVVGEDRAYAIPHIADQFPDTQVVLLDDAYQHRRVRPLFNILLTSYNNLFYTDWLLPSGRLREARSGASRADVVVVTKCSQGLDENKMMEIEKSIRHYTMAPVFFTAIHYGAPISLAGIQMEIQADTVILVSGIASHEPLEMYVKSNFKLVEHLAYNDHHAYSLSDVNRLLVLTEKYPNAVILTTEKDITKLGSAEFESVISKIPLYYLPIEITFLKDGKNFDEMVLSILKDTSGDK